MTAPARPRPRAAGATVREAGWRDLAAIAELERAAFAHDAWTEATWWAELAQRPRRVYLVVEDRTGRTAEDSTELTTGLSTGLSTEDHDGDRSHPPAVLGYAGLDLAGDTADVMTVAVHPRARGRGIGALLLAELHARAGAAGADTLMLEVRADNTTARSLYASRGYAVLHTRRGYYRDPSGGPPVDALVMRKELT